MQAFKTLCRTLAANNGSGGVQVDAAGNVTALVTQHGELWMTGQIADLSYRSFVRFIVTERVQRVFAIGAVITDRGDLWLPDETTDYVLFKSVGLPERALQVISTFNEVLVLAESGRLWLQKDEDDFKLEPLTAVVQIAAGEEHLVAVTENGQLWVRGGNGAGQLGLSYQVSRKAKPGVFTCVDLPEPVKQVAAGEGHTAVIVGSGSLWVTGNNEYGQLGLGDDVMRNSFTRVELSERVLQVAAGDAHTALITESGRLWVCGFNYHGQLGLGDKVRRNNFTRVEIPERVQQISLGGHHTILLTESGQVWASGRNDKGQLGLDDNRPCHVFVRVDVSRVQLGV